MKEATEAFNDGPAPSAPPEIVENGNKSRLSNMTYDQLVSKLGLSKPDAQRLLQKQKQKDSTGGRNDFVIPEEFLCPITQDVMKYPVLCSDGFVYEKAAIEEWLMSRRKTSPMTNLPMANSQMEYQSELAERIQNSTF